MNATDDWYEVEQLTDHSWRIAEGVLFGTYLIEGEDRALLIDAGGGAGDLRAMVESLVDVPVTLLLSHSHWDHVGSAHQFDDVRVHPVERTPDGGVNGITKGFGYGPADWIADWREAGRAFPDDFDPDSFEIPPITGVEAIEPGTTVDLGGRTLELVHVPGHSPGQLAALDREDGVLYGGDVLHNGHGLYIHFEGCDAADYLDTLANLRELRDAGAFDTLYVSHAAPVAGEDLSLLDEYYEALRAILAGEREGERVDDNPPTVRHEVAGNDVLVKPGVGSR
ncbi:MAG: MBL fold metallo-hydrolase [Haloplanus sp.]